jgi:probable rRNA maturation factor
MSSARVTTHRVTCPQFARGLESFSRSVLRHAGAPPRCSVGITLLQPTAMRELNFGTRGKDYATDVLAFPRLDEDRVIDQAGLRDELGTDATTIDGDLGRIFLCLGAVRQKIRRRPNQHHDLDTYVSVALVHSHLHLLGYTHETDAAYNTMRVQERRVMQRVVREWQFLGTSARLRVPHEER